MVFPQNRDSAAAIGGSGVVSCTPGRLIAALALSWTCLGAPAATAADALGRLFLSPEQRQVLDRRRATNRAEEEAPQIKEGPLTLDGHVQRSSGKTATWINGVPQFDGGASRDPAQVTVVPNVGEPGVRLKVGEIYDRASGKVRDSLGGGSIAVGKLPAKSKPATGPGATAESTARSR